MLPAVSGISSGLIPQKNGTTISASQPELPLETGQRLLTSGKARPYIDIPHTDVIDRFYDSVAFYVKHHDSHLSLYERIRAMALDISGRWHASVQSYVPAISDPSIRLHSVPTSPPRAPSCDGLLLHRDTSDPRRAPMAA